MGKESSHIREIKLIEIPNLKGIKSSKKAVEKIIC